MESNLDPLTGDPLAKSSTKTDDANKSSVISFDINDNDAIRAMCKEELVLAIRANSGKAVVANLVNALLDRIDGKPTQTIVTPPIDMADVTQRAIWLYKNGLATPKLINIWKESGIDITTSGVTIIENDS